MKLTAKRCECCGEAMTTVHIVETCRLCFICAMPENRKTAVIIAKNKYGNIEPLFFTDAKHILADMKETT